jgi:hypothetical protein
MLTAPSKCLRGPGRRLRLAVRQFCREYSRITGALRPTGLSRTRRLSGDPSSVPSTVNLSVPLAPYVVAWTGYDATVAVANPPQARLVWVSSPRVR